MLEREEIDRILSIAREACRADACQVSLVAEDGALTRFANGGIHQNVSERNAVVQVKAVLGKRVGYAETNHLGEDGIAEAARTAVEFARLAVENPDFVELPGPNPAPLEDAPWDAATAECTPETRARMVGEVLAAAERCGAVASGSLSTSSSAQAVANSRGLISFERSTEAHLVVATTYGSGNGWAESHAQRVGDLNPALTGERAAQGSVAANGPEAIEPGEYPVILMPSAVDEMLMVLAWMGMGALAVQEQRSWMTGRTGQRVAGANISIWDDAADPRGFVRRFDPEGVARHRVDIVRDGIAVGPVYDSLTAHKEGRKSTGHATSALGNWGPSPANLVLPTGEDDLDGLLGRMDRGLLVTRFHYTNVIHPVESTFTGMTRDGTFLVEGGRVARPVKNLRFTQNILEALSEVEAMGREPLAFRTTLCPALLIRRFRFTGSTDF